MITKLIQDIITNNIEEYETLKIQTDGLVLAVVDPGKKALHILNKQIFICSLCYTKPEPLASWNDFLKSIYDCIFTHPDLNTWKTHIYAIEIPNNRTLQTNNVLRI